MAPDTLTPNAPDMTVAPPSAPMLGVTPSTSTTPSPTEPDDDIQDPVVPETTVQALTGATIPSTPALSDHNDPLLQGFLQVVYTHLKRQMDDYYSDLKSRLGAIDTEHLRLCATLEQVTRIAKDGIEKASQHSEHAAYQWSDALLKLVQEGIQLRHAPYEATLERQDPTTGISFTITVRKQDSDALIDEVSAIEGWLTERRSPAH
jgi:hypothetical protein